MGRGISAEAISILESGEVCLQYLYEGVFSVGTLRLWSGLGQTFYEGKTYEGNGWLMGPGSMSELNTSISSGVSITLSGVPEDVIAVALNESKQSARGSLSLAILDASNRIVYVIPLFTGSLDPVKIDEGADTSSVVFDYQSRSILLNASRESRFTHEDQQIKFRGDKGFEHVSKLAGAKFYWGRSAPERTNQ